MRWNMPLQKNKKNEIRKKYEKTIKEEIKTEMTKFNIEMAKTLKKKITDFKNERNKKKTEKEKTQKEKK